ncbi:hypothetical protein RO21_06065 [[Actinobacillus] muris]|uniref:Phage tail protein n=1 Tax=Muribacter muris TaxID=67855 RepID=A0A0J5S3V4_9PAST|nr:phage tail protein [Muribacter muris]KMK51477.1 hypothetical protein RO21_06065 [[Actinobacillus] muris] [Muribacter muris]
MKLLYHRLTEYVLSLLPAHYRGNLYSWMESGKIINEGRNVTTHGIEIAHLEYEATLLFNELPFEQVNPLKLMVLIQNWLNEQDAMRYRLDIYEDPFDLEILDDSTADLAMQIKIREPILATEVETSDVEIDGICYELAPFEIWQQPTELKIAINDQSLQ